MSTRRITPSEVLAAAAFVLATFGISFALYRLVAEFREGTIIVGVSGWNYAFGVLPWLMVLLCAGVVLALRIRGLPAGIRRSLPFVAAGLAALALVFVVVAFADKPGEAEFGRSIVENIGRDELMDIAGRAMGWASVGTGIGYGAGPFLLLVAALLSLAAAALLIAGGAPATSPAGAGADGTVSPPAARSSGTSGEWRPPGACRAGHDVVAGAPPTVFAAASGTSGTDPAASGPAGSAPDGPATVAGETPTVAGAGLASAVGGRVDGGAAAGPAVEEAVAPAPAANTAAASAEAAPIASSPPGEGDPAAEAAGAAGPADVAPAEAPADPALFCVRCGTRFRTADERFCTRCGAPRPGV